MIFKILAHEIMVKYKVSKPASDYEFPYRETDKLEAYHKMEII